MRNKLSKTISFNFRATDEITEDLEKMAERYHVSKGEVIRRVFMFYKFYKDKVDTGYKFGFIDKDGRRAEVVDYLSFGKSEVNNDGKI